MQIEETGLPGLKVLTPARFGDSRGFFSESWNRRRMQEAGIDLDFVQDNHSLSRAPGTLRGLHFQSPPAAQDKLVRCGQGALFDVAVDIRKGSPSYGAWFGIELSATQITANEAQARRIGAECTAARVPWVRPKWMRADATHLDGTALHARLPAAVDFVFTCPPYYDLERYSNDGRDLCNAPSYAAFLRALDKALGGALQLLRRDRFACVVVGELRDRRTGLCRNFVSDTISIAQRHGAALYNSAVLLTAYNTAPMRARAGFRLGKLTRCHQSVLVFWKGESEASVPNAGIVPNQAISWE